MYNQKYSCSSCCNYDHFMLFCIILIVDTTINQTDVTSLLFPGRFHWMYWQTWVTRSSKRSASTLTVTDTNSSRALRGCWEASKVRKHRHTHTHIWVPVCTCERIGWCTCREKLHQINCIKTKMRMLMIVDIFNIKVPSKQVILQWLVS